MMRNQMQDAPMEIYRARLKGLSPIEVSRRTGLCYDEVCQRFTFSSLGQNIYIRWPEFSLTAEDELRCPKSLLSFGMQIVAARFLLEGKYAEPSGEYLSYREMPWGEVYNKNFQGRCVLRLAYGFGGRLEAFGNAAAALNGTSCNLGDAAYDLKFFENITVRLILWSPDEEFPPSAQFLFSDNTSAAFDAESLAAAGDILISALKEFA